MGGGGGGGGMMAVGHSLFFLSCEFEARGVAATVLPTYTFTRI